MPQDVLTVDGPDVFSVHSPIIPSSSLPPLSLLPPSSPPPDFSPSPSPSGRILVDLDEVPDLEQVIDDSDSDSDDSNDGRFCYRSDNDEHSEDEVNGGDEPDVSDNEKVRLTKVRSPPNS